MRLSGLPVKPEEEATSEVARLAKATSSATRVARQAARRAGALSARVNTNTAPISTRIIKDRFSHPHAAAWEMDDTIATQLMTLANQSSSKQSKPRVALHSVLRAPWAVEDLDAEPFPGPVAAIEDGNEF